MLYIYGLAIRVLFTLYYNTTEEAPSITSAGESYVTKDGNERREGEGEEGEKENNG